MKEANRITYQLKLTKQEVEVLLQSLNHFKYCPRIELTALDKQIELTKHFEILDRVKSQLIEQEKKQ